MCGSKASSWLFRALSKGDNLCDSLRITGALESSKERELRYVSFSRCTGAFIHEIIGIYKSWFNANIADVKLHDHKHYLVEKIVIFEVILALIK